MCTLAGCVCVLFTVNEMTLLNITAFYGSWGTCSKHTHTHCALMPFACDGKQRKTVLVCAFRCNAWRQIRLSLSLSQLPKFPLKFTFSIIALITAKCVLCSSSSIYYHHHPPLFVPYCFPPPRPPLLHKHSHTIAKGNLNCRPLPLSFLLFGSVVFILATEQVVPILQVKRAS